LNSQRNPTELMVEQNLLEDVNNDDSDYVVNINNNQNLPNNINLIDSNRNLMNNSTLNMNYATNNNINNNSNTNNTNHQNPKLRKSKFDIYLPNI